MYLFKAEGYERAEIKWRISKEEQQRIKGYPLSEEEKSITWGP